MFFQINLISGITVQHLITKDNNETSPTVWYLNFQMKAMSLYMYIPD